ncbi:MAG TPA: hypothetical protein VL614_00745 [Acetobacteraceae bacterium]|jgi:hypothetical protein|nr:hypothetical protein [Acetobacteraceae bacterium]
MKRVWVAQCLCPGRHAILALAGEANSGQEAMVSIASPLRQAVQAALQEQTINPWCSLCNAKAETWVYEIGRTRFRTMEEATPTLRESEAKQATLRRLFGDIPRSD